MDLFVLPDTERWYLTRYGQVEFFNLDSTFAANTDVMTVEVPWLGPKVSEAHDGADDPTFVIASWHHPACSSQYRSRENEREWVQQNLVATFKAPATSTSSSPRTTSTTSGRRSPAGSST